MSFSRFAAIGLSLVAGVTLASCASSGSAIPGTGPNGQVISFQSAFLFFVQGSPQLHLGITNVDLYIDNKKAGTYDFGCFSLACGVDDFPTLYTLSAGPHDFKLTQAGTLNPVFLDQVLTLKAGTKYALVAAGDAGNSNTRFDLFVVPHYATPNSSVAVSVFNASARAGPVDFLSNCDPDGAPLMCLPDFEFGPDVAVDSSLIGLEIANPKVGIPLTPAPTYCVSAYPIDFTAPLIAGWPNQTSDESLDLGCEGALVAGTNHNFFLVDSGMAPLTTSQIIEVPDQNG